MNYAPRESVIPLPCLPLNLGQICGSFLTNRMQELRITDVWLPKMSYKISNLSIGLLECSLLSHYQQPFCESPKPPGEAQMSSQPAINCKWSWTSSLAQPSAPAAIWLQMPQTGNQDRYQSVVTSHHILRWVLLDRIGRIDTRIARTVSHSITLCFSYNYMSTSLSINLILQKWYTIYSFLCLLKMHVFENSHVLHIGLVHSFSLLFCVNIPKFIHSY